jgi:regulation of enolase protein 1 (concanavalin A-like superfamily)
MASKKVLSPQEKAVAQSKRNAAKAAKFKELGEKRVTALLKQIENVQRLSNRNSYTYTQDQVNVIITACAKAFKGLEASFSNTSVAAKASITL